MDSAEWDRRYADADLVWSAEPNRWIEAEAAGLPPGRALDLAAGEARNSIWLARRGWLVTAVDFSGVALAKGRRLAASADDAAATRITWVEADLTSYRPAPGGADLVIIAYLQTPAADRGPIVARAVEAIAPGGTLLVVAHDSTNLTDGVGGPQEATVLYTPEDVVADIVAADHSPLLRIEKAERVLREVPGAPRPAIDLLVRAIRTAD